ncbi:Hypothetical protein PSEBR_cmegm101 [Pseudomonas brassicacearum subsp. brassicacearum NFM421]|uniref:Uncharacterized protein n=1 Tax=Pseudomonas brassicacearum (strain NFM421) TaxID=994484 RepID=F2KJJ4_PSEBN|nr:hypothetical protein [Pseudomonas brassicacearum]AEA70220.1 Hypothetical protein PSEBR_cmegm101 [Pseudomonas brassicacearum subsp. brassicacearum NFM421]
MNAHSIATHRIETELSAIPTSLLPVLTADRARMAAILAEELSAITTSERDFYLNQIRAAEMTRYVELLPRAAA